MHPLKCSDFNAYYITYSYTYHNLYYPIYILVFNDGQNLFLYTPGYYFYILRDIIFICFKTHFYMHVLHIPICFVNPFLLVWYQINIPVSMKYLVVRVFE